MPVLFTCPHCQAQTQVEDEYVGQTGPCFNSAKIVTVPYVEGARPRAGSKSRSVGSSVAVTAMVIVGGLFAATIMIGLVVALVFPALHAARATSTASVCQSNLERIGVALRAYHDQHGTFPPAYIADENGRPKHSWRVLILPFLNEDELHRSYSFDEPWDGPNNLNLLGMMPAVYGCPNDANAESMFETSYVVVDGLRTAFPGPNSSSLNSFTDFVGETILVVERHSSGISWLEPRDLNIRQMQFQLNAGPQDPAGKHAPGVNVLTADGKAHQLPVQLATDYLRALLTISGGETLPSDVLSND